MSAAYVRTKPDVRVSGRHAIPTPGDKLAVVPENGEPFVLVFEYVDRTSNAYAGFTAGSVNGTIRWATPDTVLGIVR